ncbi:hypothetical protein MKX01_009055 [Papaver californicum]|nr:hypothetical protein MKX01_009055 [Papaver californicum]
MVSKNVLAIGIDLGTTYSRVGFWVGEELIIRKIASCITFTNYAVPKIGDEAVDRVDPSDTILDVKRLIGVKFSDNPTQRDLLSCTFEIIANPIGKNDEPCVTALSSGRLRRFSAEELLSMILKKLKQIAEESLGFDENGGVIIIARLATKKAATMAGFGANDVCESARSKSRLRFACEDAKIFLSDPTLTETTVNVDSYHVLTSNTQSKRKALPVSIPVTQDTFDEECEDLFDRCEKAADQCVIESGIYDFHEVIVVGGKEYCVDGQGFCEIMNPDIAVIQGAAIQAAILSGEALSNPLLNSISIADVAPLSLHTLTLINLIPRNTMIPTERTHRLTTARNNQTRLCVEVHEGEDEIIENNNLTGYFFFDGIQEAEMGVPNITVTFAVDDDGILDVSAAEDESHRELYRWVINRRLTTDELEEIMRQIDAISELPDSLIHEIFFYLDTRYAVSMSLLSKRWRYLLTTPPFLNFDFKETRDFNVFVKIINRVFKLHNSSCDIQRLRISFEEYNVSDDFPDIAVLLNNWIQDAVRYNVEDLSILISGSEECNELVDQICPTLFTCKTLKGLELNLGRDWVRAFQNLKSLALSQGILQVCIFSLALYDSDVCSTYEYAVFICTSGSL